MYTNIGYQWPPNNGVGNEPKTEWTSPNSFLMCLTVGMDSLSV